MSFGPSQGEKTDPGCGKGDSGRYSHLGVGKSFLMSDCNPNCFKGNL